MDDKIIVSNRSALVAKYGSGGLAKVQAAVKKLVAADKQRGIGTRLVFLDDAKAMKAHGGSAVVDATSPRQNKAAIDAICRKVKPEYLMILGAWDVVPHQDLRNPVYSPSDDADEWAYGDLPYACEAAYSRDIARFRGPTRVVGRLPDLTGASSPAYLLKLLGIAAAAKSRAVTDYAAYFGLSTHSWRKSTALSLFNVFGNDAALTLSPPRGPSHPAKRLAPLAHFINCHGGGSDPTFYGEKGNQQPEALTTGSIGGKIRQGTVAAVECCYGAQLYDSVTLALPLPICQEYLRQGAYGYFGSSTIAYGPAEGNGAADLITQHFLLAILDGASLGRAALLARQKFVEQVAELDPVDLKTLGQFSLLGDPSLHPAQIPSPTGIPKGVGAAEAIRQQRNARRAKLAVQGEFLQRTKPTASKKAKSARKSATVQQALRNIAKKAGIVDAKPFVAYDVSAPPGARRRGTGKSSSIASRYFVAVAKPAGPASVRLVAAVAKEVGGSIVGYRIYEER